MFSCTVGPPSSYVQLYCGTISLGLPAVPSSPYGTTSWVVDQTLTIDVGGLDDSNGVLSPDSCGGEFLHTPQDVQVLCLL